MSKFPKLLMATAIATVITTPVLAEKYGLGRTATQDEIAAWDRDVFPDGSNLPEGSGSVEVGEEVFVDNCAVCHGDFAEGVGNWPKLSGGADTLADEDPLKTVGSYWPYLSTTFDYVRRSMPFGAAQTLSDDDVYGIVAYILYSNDLVDDDFVLSKETFTSVKMPNSDGFIVDDRAATEYSNFTNRCMSDCKPASVSITKTVVFPGDPNAGAEPLETQAAAPAPAPAVAEVAEVVPAAVTFDEELATKGAKVFKKCKACHKVGDKAKNGTGPILNGIWGRAAATTEGFKYSKAMLAAGDGGLVWTEDTLSGYLANPRKYLKGNKMSFSGLKKERDIAAVLEFLKSNSQ